VGIGLVPIAGLRKHGALQEGDIMRVVATGRIHKGKREMEVDPAWGQPEYQYEDCPECGSPLVNGRCPNPAKHNGGVK
jgi:hypothetical protein